MSQVVGRLEHEHSRAQWLQRRAWRRIASGSRIFGDIHIWIPSEAELAASDQEDVTER